MARHRNVRNYAYEDEMSEDVYGHSVEECDMCISPSTAQQFMYNRGNDHQHSDLYGNYISGRFGSVEEEEEAEQSEEEDHLASAQDYRRPQLDPISEAKLSSCLDQLQSVLGDDCHEPTAVDAILKYNFDAEKALDYIFTKEKKKGNSKKKTAKKQDSNMCRKLLKRNIVMPIRSQNIKDDGRLGALPSHPEANRKSIDDNNSVSDTNSLLSMPLSNFMMEGKKKNSNKVTALEGNIKDSSLLMGASEMSHHDFPQCPWCYMSLEKFSKTQTENEKSVQESSLHSLVSACKPSLASSLDCHSSMSLGKISSSSGKTRDTLTLPLLSSLAKLHDAKRAKPMGISGVSLQELSDQRPSSLANESMSSNKPEDMLTSTSLFSLAKQHDDSNRAKPMGISGMSLQELANHMPSSLANDSMSSNKPEDFMTFTSLSSLAKQHDDSNRAKPMVLTGIFLQDLAKQIPSSLTDQGKRSPGYSDGVMDVQPSSSSLGNQQLADSPVKPRPGQNTQVSTQELLFTTSLSSLASLSLNTNSSSLIRPGMPGMNHEWSGNNNSAAFASGVLAIGGSNSETSSGLNTRQPRNKQSSLNQKLSNRKTQGSRVEEKLSKVSQKSIKKNKPKRFNPTMFAQTLCHKRKRSHSFPEHLKSQKLCTLVYHSHGDITPFPFSSPSPDDVIKIKQCQRFRAQSEH